MVWWGPSPWLLYWYLVLYILLPDPAYCMQIYTLMVLVNHYISSPHLFRLCNFLLMMALPCHLQALITKLSPNFLFWWISLLLGKCISFPLVHFFLFLFFPLLYIPFLGVQDTCLHISSLWFLYCFLTKLQTQGVGRVIRGYQGEDPAKLLPLSNHLKVASYTVYELIPVSCIILQDM